MTSTRPYLRKKAVLIMFKVFLKFPDALRPAFPRLKEKLEDPDPGWSVGSSSEFFEFFDSWGFDRLHDDDSFDDLGGYFFGNVRDKTSNITLRPLVCL